MSNVDNKSISGTSCTLGCGFDGATAMRYIVTNLQLLDTGIKIASVCMLGQESKWHIRETCIKGKGREKEGTKKRIRNKGKEVKNQRTPTRENKKSYKDETQKMENRNIKTKN